MDDPDHDNGERNQHPVLDGNTAQDCALLDKPVHRRPHPESYLKAISSSFDWLLRQIAGKQTRTLLSSPLLGSPRELHPFFGEPHPFFFIARADRPLCLLEAFLSLVREIA